jgi:F420-non-reducing hydrogenase small subunit
MGSKARLSIEWLSGCSGCEVAFADLHDELPRVLKDEVELVRIPILMDTKDYPQADVGMVTGSIRTEHDIKAAHAMRDSCKTIVAFGTCPVYGGPHAASYAHTTRELLNGAFVGNPTTRTKEPPDQVPRLLEEDRTLDTEIEVDLYMPGCPPHPAFIIEGLRALVQDRKPRIEQQNVCFKCGRKMDVRKDVHRLIRSYEGEFDRDLCFLSQGCLCFGSVALDRCLLAPCPNAGVPCFSCGGPSVPVILEPQKDVRTLVALRMAHLTSIPEEDIVAAIERQAKTHYAYAMASPIFRYKPTFSLREWIARQEFDARG